ncbi:MAG TPA: ABC transporter ATP-binding protein [Mobilitalea sp.]|nr:ABC transporter ATP-binding protein [Mobilitalea sp.]
MKPIINIEGLTKDYGNHKGIFGLTFSVEEGEVFGYLGPNGAGKTTTIRHLMGFLTPDKGSSQILGMDTRTRSADIMKFLGYLPGEIAFFDQMTGVEFLKFMGEMRGLNNTKLRDRLIDLFQLDTKSRIRKMSKGMKQKLGIICAFMHDPKVLILDEPTSGLDPLMQKVFADLILEEKSRGKTILMSSHSFEEIERTCDRVGIIKRGELVATENMHDIKQKRRKTYVVTFDNAVTAADFAKSHTFDIADVNYNTVRLSIMGNVTDFIKSLDKYTVLDLYTERSSLEDIFMHYYGDSETKN